jgi:hypothetical protein
MIVSGHIYIFEALSFDDGRPPQLVVRTGGDNLVDIPPRQSKGAEINGTKVGQGLIFARFGIWFGATQRPAGAELSSMRVAFRCAL